MVAPATASASQRNEPNLNTPRQGLAPRRGRDLFIDTNLSTGRSGSHDAFASVQRPAPIETVLYSTSHSRSGTPEPSSHANSRRVSRIGFRSIFKGKTSKGRKHDDLLWEGLDEGEEPASQTSTGGSLFFQPPPKEPVREKPAAMKLKNKKERPPSALPPRPSMTWDPPPLFQAQPSAIKAGSLLTPVLPADTVLRMEKDRRNQEVKVDMPSVVEDDAEEGEPKKLEKRQRSNSIDCTKKLFLLTTTGFVLQYAEEGNHDRLPERIMQLGRDSAAFASDAITGKHWVLQICQTSCDNGAVTNEARKSVFTKLGFGGSIKRPVSNFLLVMNSAKEMESWLVALRREIHQLGGKSYRPDEAARNSSLDAIRLLREKPSRRFLVESNPIQRSGLTSPTSPHLRSYRSSIALPHVSEPKPPTDSPNIRLTRLDFNENFPHPSYLHASTPVMSGRPSLGRRASSAAILQSPTSLGPTSSPSTRAPRILNAREPNSPVIMVPNSPAAKDRNSPTFRGPTSPASRTPNSPGLPNVDKALPAAPGSSLSPKTPINALGIIASERGYGFATPKNSLTTEEKASPSAPQPSKDKPRSMPISAYNSDLSKGNGEHTGATSKDRKLSTESTDTATRNFSIPNFSGCMHAQRVSDDTATLSGSITTSRGRTPSLSDGESTRPDSVVGELAHSIRSFQRPFKSQLEVAVAVPMSPMRAETVDNKLPEIHYIPPEARPSIPKRMSSLEYGHGQLPWSAPEHSPGLPEVYSASASPLPRLQPVLPVKQQNGNPPFPPPAVSLPNPPSSKPTEGSSHPHSKPTQGSIKRKKVSSPQRHKRTSSMKLRDSPRKNRPAAPPSTLKLPKAAPMTIQERRMLLGKNNITHLPPPLPPPTGALPLPPTAPPSGPLPPVPMMPRVTSGAPVVMLQPIKAPGTRTLSPITIASSTVPVAPLTPPKESEIGAVPERPKFERDNSMPDSPPDSEKPEVRREIGEIRPGKIKETSHLEDGTQQAKEMQQTRMRTRQLLNSQAEPAAVGQSSNTQLLQPLQQSPSRTERQTNSFIPEIKPLTPLDNSALRSRFGPAVPGDLPRSPVTESWATFLERAEQK